MASASSVQTISVIVPKSPFVRTEQPTIPHCLAALDVEKLMQWWPGAPHQPHRDPGKVRAIQRSLDWKRVAQIAAYLLQREILEAPTVIDRYFKAVYEPRKFDSGRQWPPNVPRVVGFQRSEYPTFSNVLLHVNGATVKHLATPTAKLIFDEKDPKLNFSVIDGQHRINGGYLAVRLLREKEPNKRWEIPAEIFIDLDHPNDPPRRQAQIFIDVNSYQKKVDRSLVADLFPTARGERGPLDDKERAQDLGRKLMLDVGPLVGMIQIPGVRYGVKDVVTLATVNSAIEDVLDVMNLVGIDSLEGQSQFLAECLDAWFEATGRREQLEESEQLDPANVAYQGRVVVSFLSLIPVCIWKLKRANAQYISEEAKTILTSWLLGVMKRAGLLYKGRFLPKNQFGGMGFLGSGGIARFRDTLWAATLSPKDISKLSPEKLSDRANRYRARVHQDLR